MSRGEARKGKARTGNLCRLVEACQSRHLEAEDTRAYHAMCYFILSDVVSESKTIYYQRGEGDSYYMKAGYSSLLDM